LATDLCNEKTGVCLASCLRSSKTSQIHSAIAASLGVNPRGVEYEHVLELQRRRSHPRSMEVDSPVTEAFEPEWSPNISAAESAASSPMHLNEEPDEEDDVEMGPSLKELLNADTEEEFAGFSPRPEVKRMSNFKNFEIILIKCIVNYCS